ncbi:MAG: hypothetical protein NZ527_06645 [Hydrogenobacter thermophilus]|uniref:hypothetical protein n=1 Tax=Hydrogenobacter thermophilus TaxID=940 RepID=UPI0030FD1153|nr:hypothetical protein [Hydrogenobacter thermophilus]
MSSVRLKLFGDDLYVDLVYEQEVEARNPVGEYTAGIDIGLIRTQEKMVRQQFA